MKHRTPLRPEILAKRREADVSRWLVMLAREGGHEATLVHADKLLEQGGAAAVRAAYGLEIAAHEAVVGSKSGRWSAAMWSFMPLPRLAKALVKKLLPMAMYSLSPRGGTIQFETVGTSPGFDGPVTRRHWTLRRVEQPIVGAPSFYILSWEDQ